MIPTSLGELSELIDMLRARGVDRLEYDTFKISLAPAPVSAPVHEEKASEPETPDPNTGLTPSQEREWFHSSG